MQEIKKTRIVIASVLKPIDDTRMYEKIGKSLKSRFEVHVIGIGTNKPDAEVKFHGIGTFTRMSLKRFLASVKIFFLLIKIKPRVLVITTHELLGVGVLTKILTRCKVVYDVQENYYRNILYTKAFPTGLRYLIAIYVRWKENIFNPFIDHFILAEKGYAQELTFLSKNVTIIENKYHKTGYELARSFQNDSAHIDLVFSGTLSTSTGVFIAIDLAIALNKLDQRISLTLIGYCSLPEELTRLQRLVENYSFIKLLGGSHLIPHRTIIETLSRAHFGIISYPPNPATINCMPTKLYEYLGLKLPILLLNHPVWAEYCNPFNAAVTFNMNFSEEASFLLSQMENQIFYTQHPQSVFWETEEIKLHALIDQLVQ